MQTITDYFESIIAMTDPATVDQVMKNHGLLDTLGNRATAYEVNMLKIRSAARTAIRQINKSA